MTELSPAARAVRLAAINAEPGQTISAALRAAADLISSVSDDMGLMSNAFWAGRASAATKLLAIATELENIQ